MQKIEEAIAYIPYLRYETGRCVLALEYNYLYKMLLDMGQFKAFHI